MLQAVVVFATCIYGIVVMLIYSLSENLDIMKKLVFLLLGVMIAVNLVAQKASSNQYEVESGDSPEIIANPECRSSFVDTSNVKLINKIQSEKDLPAEKISSLNKQEKTDIEDISKKNNIFIPMNIRNENIVSEAEYQIRDYLNNVEKIELNVRTEQNRLARKMKADRWKIVGLYSTAIILNGIGDGLNNTNSKTIGHFVNAASVAVLLSTPFFIDYDKSKWYWYLLTYASLRLSLLDVTYNVTTRQPINFIGSTAITDKIYKKLDIYNASKTMGLVVGFTIPFGIL